MSSIQVEITTAYSTFSDVLLNFNQRLNFNFTYLRMAELVREMEHHSHASVRQALILPYAHMHSTLVHRIHAETVEHVTVFLVLIIVALVRHHSLETYVKMKGVNAVVY